MARYWPRTSQVLLVFVVASCAWARDLSDSVGNLTLSSDDQEFGNRGGSVVGASWMDNFAADGCDCVCDCEQEDTDCQCVCTCDEDSKEYSNSVELAKRRRRRLIGDELVGSFPALTGEEPTLPPIQPKIGPPTTLPPTSRPTLAPVPTTPRNQNPPTVIYPRSKGGKGGKGGKGRKRRGHGIHRKRRGGTPPLVRNSFPSKGGKSGKRGSSSSSDDNGGDGSPSRQSATISRSSSPSKGGNSRKQRFFDDAFMSEQKNGKDRNSKPLRRSSSPSKEGRGRNRKHVVDVVTTDTERNGQSRDSVRSSSPSKGGKRRKRKDFVLGASRRSGSEEKVRRSAPSKEDKDRKRRDDDDVTVAGVSEKSAQRQSVLRSSSPSNGGKGGKRARIQAGISDRSSGGASIIVSSHARKPLGPIVSTRTRRSRTRQRDGWRKKRLLVRV